MTYRRFVAIGDSFTEGVGDVATDGALIGWADRLAGHLATQQPELTYANLAIRGRKTLEVHDEQLDPALALTPDLASVACGVNDVLRVKCDSGFVGDRIEQMVSAFREADATTIVFSLPNFGAVHPAGKVVSRRVHAINRRIASIAEEHDAVLVSLPIDMLRDGAIWSDDRLHLNALGHARVAHGVAGLLGIEADPTEPIVPGRPARTLPRQVIDRATWIGTHAAPWVYRRVTGRSSGDGITAKRPDLRPLP